MRSFCERMRAADRTAAPRGRGRKTTLFLSTIGRCRDRCRGTECLIVLPKGSPAGPDQSGASRSGRPPDGDRSSGIGRESRDLLAPLEWIRDSGRLVNLDREIKKEGDCCKGQPSLSCAMFCFACWIRRRSEYGDIHIGCSRGQRSPAPRAHSWRSDPLRESLDVRGAPVDGLLDPTSRTTTHEALATIASSWFWCWTERPRRVSIPTAPPGG